MHNLTEISRYDIYYYEGQGVYDFGFFFMVFLSHDTYIIL